ncbi:MAG: pyruvoyl-dependent arginine decarboxylase [Actinomycetota bacterium]|nr:pyruvoyl-dependent arginine decarboxylase [Actinomycetota bacterium]MDQ3648085.1 pyruvoyl-dependent arginine decarboxylase [Actinomycetota bacterium]
MSFEVTVTSGTGEGVTPLAAFDAALETAGIQDYNLIYMSSIIPPGSRVIRGRLAQTDDHHGDRLYVVIARRTVSEAGHEASAGLGWAQRSDGRGVFVEGMGTGEHGVHENIEASLASITARRGSDWDELRFETATIQCHEHPVCAVVAAAYASEPWR